MTRTPIRILTAICILGVLFAVAYVLLLVGAQAERDSAQPDDFTIVGFSIWADIALILTLISAAGALVFAAIIRIVKVQDSRRTQ